MTRSALYVGVALVLATVPALGSETSERLVAHGLAKFHNHRYEEALRLFDQAVEADASDAQALYYRGVCRGRLNQIDGAITDLRAALAINPDLTPAALELGVALIQTGAYTDAIAPLERARTDPTLAARAALFLGIAHLRAGQLGEARSALEQASQDPSLEVSAQYYLGVVAYQQKQWMEAESRFAAVVDLDASSSMGQEATKFLERLRSAGSRWYRLYGSVGLQYDSNVVLAPATDIPALGITQQADGRVVLNAAADVVPWENPRASLVAGYNFFQSLHFELTDFNLQEHRVSMQVAGNYEWLRYGLLARYSYYLLETDSFLQEATALPWVTANEAEFGRTELYYRNRYRDFLTQPYEPQLNSLNYAFGLRQVFYLGKPDRLVSIGYQFDRQSPTNSSGDQFGYNGNEVNAGFGWILPAEIALEAGYSFRYEDYDAASGGRIDTPSQFAIALTKELTQYIALNLAYLGTIHDSNIEKFDYNRNIVSLILEAAY